MNDISWNTGNVTTVSTSDDVTITATGTSTGNGWASNTTAVNAGDTLHFKGSITTTNSSIGALYLEIRSVASNAGSLLQTVETVVITGTGTKNFENSIVVGQTGYVCARTDYSTAGFTINFTELYTD